ncbi:carbohydrate esterase family 5 protein [Xylaria arbuscula]|nr:carbohydrate esterase family 5 protein [Xylaria arbuscula]
MKLIECFVSAALAIAASAGPINLDHIQDVDAVLDSRATGTTANDYVNGGCKEVILFYARGSTQPGNMGDQPGPQTADGLIAALGTSKIAIQGVDYGADLLSNLLPGGCNPTEAKSFATLLTGAATKCPSSKFVVSGYSQGAALVHAAVEQLAATARARIYAAVTYGDTQKKQDGGKIPNFDASKTLILCNNGDLVCEGSLIITSAHLDYTPSVPTGVSFIVSKLG